MISFYYVSKYKNDVPVRPTDQKEWSTYIDENRIVRSTQKRAYEPSQRIPDNGDTISPSHAKLHETARKRFNRSVPSPLNDISFAYKTMS